MEHRPVEGYGERTPDRAAPEGAGTTPAPTLADFSIPMDGGPAAPAVPWHPPAGAAPPKASPGWADRLKILGPVGLFLAFLLGKGKLLALLLAKLSPLLKFGLPVLKTGGTMLLSVFVYAQTFGWWFAGGFVLSIFVHEMGHVYVAWRKGVPVSAPLFIPGFGALILQKEAAKSTWDEALIGIGGPVAGTLAALFCWVVHLLTGSPLMLALAYTGFLINLFNLAPIFPLDGGWITGAVSPRLWLVGIILMVGMFATGMVRNPFILLLLLLSLPRLWKGLKSGDATPEGGVPATPNQRITMGLAYVGLCGLLLWLMAHTHRPL
jgi:Zn-dependent protease